MEVSKYTTLEYYKSNVISPCAYGVKYPVNCGFQIVALLVIMIIPIFISLAILDSSFSLFGIEIPSPSDQAESANDIIGTIQIILIIVSVIFPPVGPALVLVNFSRAIALIFLIVKIQELSDENDELQRILDSVVESVEELARAIAEFLGLDEDFISNALQILDISEVSLEDFGIERKEERAKSFTIVLLLFTFVQIGYGVYFEYNRITAQEEANVVVVKKNKEGNQVVVQKKDEAVATEV
eukprot:snap_masked-scaffold_54-processed-gene-1.46-mRNA-1 protein AED:1.00 eAED:1.00 QI:0/-1/0/0/-1/1/1/0/240